MLLAKHFIQGEGAFPSYRTLVVSPSATAASYLKEMLRLRGILLGFYLVSIEEGERGGLRRIITFRDGETLVDNECIGGGAEEGLSCSDDLQGAKVSSFTLPYPPFLHMAGCGDEEEEEEEDGSGLECAEVSGILVG